MTLGEFSLASLDPRAHLIGEWLAVLDRLTHYELLGLVGRFTEEELQAAFHRFSEHFHPDRHPRASEELRQQIRLIFQRGADAYRVLKNPRLRAQYDLGLATETPPPVTDATTPAPRTLDALCSTPGGRLHARQADRAISEGRLDEALVLLEKSIRTEGDNPELRERWEALRFFMELSRPPSAS